MWLFNINFKNITKIHVKCKFEKCCFTLFPFKWVEIYTDVSHQVLMIRPSSPRSLKEDRPL